MDKARQTIMGVDPGTKGAIFSLTVEPTEPIIFKKANESLRKTYEYWPMPMNGKGRHNYNLDAIAAIVREVFPNFLIIEKVTRPASLVRCMGIFEAVGATLGIETHTVRPQVWKPFWKLSTDKAESIARAQTLWPGLELRKKDDGIAEAGLIAEYWRRQGLEEARITESLYE
jgi:hypothetical protein